MDSIPLSIFKSLSNILNCLDAFEASKALSLALPLLVLPFTLVSLQLLQKIFQLLQNAVHFKANAPVDVL